MTHLYFVDIPGTADNPHALLDQCPGYSGSNSHRGAGHQGHSAFPPLHLHRHCSYTKQPPLRCTSTCVISSSYGWDYRYFSAIY